MRGSRGLLVEGAIDGEGDVDTCWGIDRNEKRKQVFFGLD